MTGRTSFRLSGLAVSGVVLISMLATSAGAAALRTVDGGSATVECVRLHLQGQRGWSVGVGEAAGLSWRVVDGAGQVHQGLALDGTVPSGAPVLAQNPLTGELHLVYSRYEQGSADIVIRTWLGQDWSDARWLAGAPDGDDLEPRLAFTAQGDALLAWVREGAEGPHLLVQHGLLDAAGMVDVHSYLDLGHPSAYLEVVSADVQAGEGLVLAAADGLAGRAWLLFADADADAAGVVELDLATIRDIIDGGSFAPVPVNVMQRRAFNSGGGSDPSDLDGAGRFIVPWRAEVAGGEAFYWIDSLTVRGVGFRDRESTGLLTVPHPGHEASAHVAILSRLLREMGRVDGRLPSLLQREPRRRSLRP